jgi:serine/threonine protein kinase
LLLIDFFKFFSSVAYLAPEMLRRTGHNRTVDWYLLGVLIYEMLVGIPPYFSSNRDELFQNIQKAQLKLPKILSEEAKNLITSVTAFLHLTQILVT